MCSIRGRRIQQSGKARISLLANIRSYRIEGEEDYKRSEYLSLCCGRASSVLTSCLTELVIRSTSSYPYVVVNEKAYG